jgi:hypothetical protein
MFLLASLKSTWGLIRQMSFDLLAHMPDNHEFLKDKTFVNEVIYKSAMIFCDNPKAPIAEGSGLMLKFLFVKCLPQLEFIDV